MPSLNLPWIAAARKCKRPRESQSRSREPIKSAPCQGRNSIIGATPSTNQVTLRRGRTLSTTLHLSLRDNLSEERVDLEGFEPSPATMTGCYAANYTTGPRTKAYFSYAKAWRPSHAFIESRFRFGTESGAPLLAFFARRGLAARPRVPENANGSGNPRSRLREPINRYPVKVTIIIGPTPPQIKLLQGGPHPSGFRPTTTEQQIPPVSLRSRVGMTRDW